MQAELIAMQEILRLEKSNQQMQTEEVSIDDLINLFDNHLCL